MIGVWIIVLLVIAAVVLLILFYPLRYRLDVDFDERKGSLQLYWMFRLLRFRFWFDEEIGAVMSILFFHIDFLNGDRRARRKEKREKREEKKRKKRGEEEEEEKSTVQRVTGAVKSVARAVSLLREYDVLTEALPPVRIFLFRTRPRDVHGRIVFGMRDPSRTGYIVGMLAAIPFLYQTDLEVNPDFETEETYVNGFVHAKGHTMTIHVLILAVRLFGNRNIRAFIGALRNKK